MGRRDDLIAAYAEELRTRLSEVPEMALLTRVTTGCGPAIYSADGATIALERPSELEAVRNNFLIRKLGLSDGPKLDEAIHAVVERYGASERKSRAVVYYMLTKHFGREWVYG